MMLVVYLAAVVTSSFMFGYQSGKRVEKRHAGAERMEMEAYFVGYNDGQKLGWEGALMTIRGSNAVSIEAHAGARYKEDLSVFINSRDKR